MRILYLSFSVVFVDQISKLLVKGFSVPFLNINYEGMYHGEMIPVIGDFFRLTFIENPGMAFGFDPGSNFKLLISIFSLIASIGLIFYLYVIRNKSLSLKIGIALILGGAIGNLIDRAFYGIIFDYAPLFYGKVVDFFDVDFFNFTLFGRSYDRWPVFNIADASVTIGVLILLIFYRKHQDDEELTTEKLAASSTAGDEIVNINDQSVSNDREQSRTDGTTAGNLSDEQTDNRKEIQN